MIYDDGIPDFLPLDGLDDLRKTLPSIFEYGFDNPRTMIAVVNAVNRMGLITGQMADNWHVVETWIRTNGIDDTVIGILNGWVADGTMAKILDQTALKEINKKLDDLEIKHDTDIANTKAYAKSLFDSLNSALKDAENKLQQHIIDGDNAVRQYVDSKINGDPQGFFDSVGDLQNKYPNGAEGIYIVKGEAGANWYYWNGSSWEKGGSYLQADMTQVDQQIGNFNNYLKNNQLLDGVAPARPFTATNLSVAHFSGKKWLHIVGDSTTQYQGVAWDIDPTQAQFQYFSSTYKKLTFTLQSDNTALFYVQLQNYKSDGSRTGVTTLKRVNVVAGTQVEISLDFNIPNFSGESEHYELVIAQDTGIDTAFNICNYVLSDSVTMIDTDSKVLVDKRVKPAPNFTTRIKDGQLFNGEYYQVTGKDNTTAYKGIQWNINNVPESYDSSGFVKFEGDIQSSTSQLFHFSYQVTDRNNDVVYTEFIGTMFLIANRMTHFSFIFKPKSGDYTRAKYIIYSGSVSDVNFYVSTDTTVERFFFAGTGNDKFNNYLYNFSPNFSTNIAPVKWLGTSWLKITSDDSVTNWQGIQFNVDITDQADVNKDYTIKFDMYTGEVKKYHVITQYFDDIGTLLQQDSLDVFTAQKEVFQHSYDYRVRAIDKASYMKFIIYQEAGTKCSFVVKDATMKPKVNVENNTPTVTGTSTLPVIDIQGDLTGMDKDTPKDVVVVIKYDDKTLTEFATCKWQGDSSLQYPKKAYRLIFFTDESRADKKKIKILPLDKPTNAINVKANWLDWTNLNNLIISRYVADFTIENSTGLEKDQVEANNQEQVDGYSCNVLLNGIPNGLYNVSDKKSDKLFNADEDNVNHAVIEGSKWGDPVEFKADEAVFDENVDYSIEVPDALTDELKASFNKVLKLTNSGTDEEFTAGIADVINLDSVVNWIVTATVFGLHDNMGKNICWQTRDGVKWSAVDYDHDLAYGMEWTGQTWNTPETWDLVHFTTTHKLVKRLITNKLINDKLISAYQKFKTLHSKIDVINEYKKGMTEIGALNYDNEFKIWSDKPAEGLYTTQDLFNYINKRYDLCDTWFTTEFLEGIK